MADADKQKFVDMAALDRVRYDTEMEEESYWKTWREKG